MELEPELGLELEPGSESELGLELEPGSESELGLELEPESGWGLRLAGLHKYSGRNSLSWEQYR